jgi:hypothetical protein
MLALFLMAGGAPQDMDRHGAGVTLNAQKPDPGHRPLGHRSAMMEPSDPRRAIVPRGGAARPDLCVPERPDEISVVRVLVRARGPMVRVGSLVRLEQTRTVSKAPQDLAFRTGPNTVSILSSLMA